MVGYVCTVAGGKGGVGKTTTAVNVAAALQKEGYDVVVLDADLGMSNLGAMLGVDVGTSIHEILAGGRAVTDALVEAQGGITVAPGEQSLEAFADADPTNLENVVDTLRNAYDVVVVDSGAGLSHETTVPLELADGILLVTTPDEVAVGDAVKTRELAERLDASVFGALVTRVTADTDVDAIDDAFETPLLGVIPEDVAATADEPLVLNAPESAAADAHLELASALESLFFRATEPEDVEQVIDAAWFERAQSTAQEGDHAAADKEASRTDETQAATADSEADDADETDAYGDDDGGEGADEDEDETFGLFN